MFEKQQVVPPNSIAFLCDAAYRGRFPEAGIYPVDPIAFNGHAATLSTLTFADGPTTFTLQDAERPAPGDVPFDFAVRIATPSRRLQIQLVPDIVLMEAEVTADAVDCEVRFNELWEPNDICVVVPDPN